MTHLCCTRNLSFIFSSVSLYVNITLLIMKTNLINYPIYSLCRFATICCKNIFHDITIYSYVVFLLLLNTVYFIFIFLLRCNICTLLGNKQLFLFIIIITTVSIVCLPAIFSACFNPIVPRKTCKYVFYTQTNIDKN